MEHERTAQTCHCTEKEEKQHHLFVPGEVVNLDILKEEGDVVTENVHSHAQNQEEHEAKQVGPDVPRLSVQAEHALHTATEGVHGRPVVSLKKLIILHPLRKLIKWNCIPCPVDNLLHFLLNLNFWQ